MSDADGRQVGCGPALTEFESRLTLQGRVGERLMPVACKATVERLRRFESYSCHQMCDIPVRGEEWSSS